MVPKDGENGFWRRGRFPGWWGGNSSFETWWNLDTTRRGGQLSYQKAVAVAGGAGGYNGQWESANFCIEFDLGSGAGNVICFTRNVDGNATGVVVRSPWVEGA